MLMKNKSEVIGWKCGMKREKRINHMSRKEKIFRETTQNAKERKNSN